MLIFQITKAILDNYTNGLIFFQKFEGNIRDELVIQLCSIFRYMTFNKQNKPPPDIPYFPFSRKDVYKVLIRLGYNIEVDFLSRLRCCEQIDNIDMSRVVLKSVVDWSLVQVMEKGINFDHFFNHFLLFFMDESDDDTKELFQKLVTRNTIARGYNNYYAVQKMSLGFDTKNTQLPGVSKTMNLGSRKPNKELTKHGLNAYFFGNRDQMRNYLVPTLQIYKRKKWLTEEHLRIAQGIVEGDQQLTFDLADFMITLGNNFAEFVRWGHQHIRGDRVEGNNINFFTGAQSVHQLDGNRQKFIGWLISRSKNFDLDKSFSKEERDLEENKIVLEENHHSRELLNKIEGEGNKDEKIWRSFQRMITDNTKLSISKEVTWNLRDVFHRIVFVVANHPQRDLLIIRLREELTEMSGTCYSGHLNRLFNVFSGIEEDLVVVDIFAEIRKNIKVELQSIIDNAPENISDRILDILGTENWKDDELVNYIRFTGSGIEEKMKDIYVFKNKNISLKEFDEMFKEEINKYFGTEIYL